MVVGITDSVQLQAINKAAAGRAALHRQDSTARRGGHPHRLTAATPVRQRYSTRLHTSSIFESRTFLPPSNTGAPQLQRTLCGGASRLREQSCGLLKTVVTDVDARTGNHVRDLGLRAAATATPCHGIEARDEPRDYAEARTARHQWLGRQAATVSSNR